MKNKFTGTRKYNWPELKAKFMASSYKEAGVFIKEEVGTFNGTIAKNIKGWTHEKELKEKEAFDIEEARMRQAKAEDIIKAYSNLIEGIKMHVKDVEAIKKLSVGDILILWKILRTENGLPIQIVRNLNTDTKLPDKPPPLSEQKTKELETAMNILKLNSNNGMERDII